MKQGKVKDKKNDNGGEDDRVATTISDFLIVYDSDVVNFACKETSWMIDSGASIHATPRKDFFTSYTSGDFGSVRMGNDGSTKAISMGYVRLETSNGTMLILKNVKHIPDIRMNLISTAKGKKCSSLYLMQTRVIDSSINAVDDDSTVEIWHKRLGHMSEKGLMILAKRNLLSGLKKRSLKCAHCLARKQTRVAFKTHRHTRKLMLEVFKQFHALVERQSGEKLKCIQTDNEGEYSGPFDEYCRQHGIRHQKTPPKTPQLNGLVERMNRTLVERNLMFWIEFGQIMKSLMITCVSLDARLLCTFENERSKLDAKTRPCITIRDIEKTATTEFQYSDNLIDLVPVPLTHLPTQVEDETHDDQHDIGDVEIPTQVPPNIPLRRSTRDRHPSTRFSVDDYVLLTDGKEPESFEEAIGDENKMKWVDAMQDKMKSLHENHSFEFVKLPKGKRALKNRWVYRVKQEEHTSQPRYKARLVVKGFSQKKGVDFDEIFSPVVKISSIREVLGLATSLDLEIEQMDVKTAFLHGTEAVKQLSKSFSMKDLGPTKKILGIRIKKDRASKKLHMSQEQNIEKVLERFNMSKTKVVSSPLASHFKLSSRHSPSINKEKEDMRRVTYASVVGSLMYVMVCTRPDIAYAVDVVSHILSNPGRLHWEAVKWIMRYLRCTSKLKLTFGSGKPVLVGYTNSNMAGDVDNRRSTSGYLMTFSGGVVSCAIHLSKNSTFHARSKHIDVRYHWMRDALNDNLFELEKIHTNHNGSDMLTKSLPREKLEVCCSIAGMASPST
ncbi:hypothetical protein AAG906_035707 [Vitis piasezkii]